ncbi:helix-turn-helix domain-containing protein [Aridibaculum aurantiacum]|uniref:helix-turn-helix domain-containing protein n=1 Tax=Aridibaculum aurantiacum TaxID=2810307 RepID=UPI001A97BBFB|nr:AraC family transcriptional regulator [Aridibaculum aurantiacum]
MHLYIKNMVCNRCINVVEQELQKLQIGSCKVTLGEVETSEVLPKEKIEQLEKNLQVYGFELLDNSKQQLIEKIKNIIIQQVHYKQDGNNLNFSDILSKSLHKDYSYLSSLFSEVEGITIEKYLINQKIEKVKELIIYDELSLSEIAYQLGYSSIAHLSSQFKKVTGLTPTHFKKVGQNKRKPLDGI